MSPDLMANRALQIGTLSVTLPKFYIIVDQQKEKKKVILRSWKLYFFTTGSQMFSVPSDL